MRLFFLALVVGLPAFAQEAETHKQILQRQQASDAFAQQLRQSQEAMRLAPSSPERRWDLEATHLAERQRLDNIAAAQQREANIERPADLRPIERQHAADERRPYIVPSGGIVHVPPRSCRLPRPLVSEPDRLPIEAPKAASC